MSRRLKVLSVITDLGFGGGESRTLAFARAIDRDRFEHAVVSLYGHDAAYDARWGSVRDDFRDADVELLDLGEAPRERLLGAPSPAGVVESATVITRMVRKLAAIIRARGIDVVDAQHITASVFGLMAGKWTGTPTTVTEYHTGYWERPGMRLAGRCVLRMPEALICDSQMRRDEINAWLIAAHPRAVVIPNGVPRPVPTRPAEAVRRFFQLPDAPGTKVVAQVSRLVPYKGHSHLLKAARRVLAAAPDTYFLLVGFAGEDPSYLPALEAEAAALGIRDRVRIGGYPGPVGDVWQLVDVHAHASVFDSLPIAITEGMALARPAVVTRVGGIPEMVTHERTGLVVEPADPVALADGILRMIREPETARRLGEAALARYEHGYRPEVMARALEALFTELAAERRRGRWRAPGMSRG